MDERKIQQGNEEKPSMVYEGGIRREGMDGE